MARGKAINVKIATPKVIKALEAALAKLESDYKSQEANEKKYEKARKAWAKEVTELALKNISKVNPDSTRVSDGWRGLNVDIYFEKDAIKLPDEPERDFVTIHEHTYSEQKREIENAIRILKMTDEEVVNTSTYNAVAQYL